MGVFGAVAVLLAASHRLHIYEHKVSYLILQFGILYNLVIIAKGYVQGK